MSGQQKKIVMAESLGWNSLSRVGSHHYARQFAGHGYDVCWFTHPISPLHFLSGSYRAFAPEIREKLGVWKQGGLRSGSVFSYTPMTLVPYGNYPLLRSGWTLRNTLRITVPPVRSVLARNGFRKVDVLWITNPALAGLRTMVEHRVCAFRIADDTSAFADSPQSIQEQERELAEKADIVFVASPVLRDKFNWAGPKVHYLPNGVDIGHFADQETGLPREYREIPAPRAVYVGAIAEWFDLERLDEAARALPHCSFVLIGEPRIDCSRLKERRNVFFLGGRPYQDIPAYLCHAQVGIIPFKRSRLIESVNPIKLFEYMACGLPVVATRWKTLEEINSPAILAGSGPEFAAAIDRAIRAPEKRDRYVEFAKSNSWETRFREITRLLEGIR